ncbi:MAG: glycosyltransferase family 2 protein [Halioglobus sp.]
MSPSPTVSVIVIAYRMSSQLENTLLTLAPEFQQGVTADDYEVIVVENSSSDNLPVEKVAKLPSNFRYLLREETAVSPVHAINIAFDMCKAPYICLMIDGARMVSPGIIYNALMAYAISENAVVAVPGYHLGHEEQHLVEGDPNQAETEKALLASVDWQSDGYELFRISTFSGANSHGYLHPLMECNCLFGSAKNYAAIGNADTQFQLHGGGSINLHMYRSLGMLPGTALFVLPGEGSFHQFHGGVTTSSYRERAEEIERHRVQLHSLWPEGFSSLRRESTLLGRVPPQAKPFLIHSLQRAQKRNKRLIGQGKDPWEDDTALNRQPGHNRVRQ